MKKIDIIQRIFDVGVIAIIRTETASQAADIAEACAEGGITLIEVTFTVPKAHKVLEQLSDKFSSTNVILGAGTVLDSETARIAMLSGAEYIVSPVLDIDMIKCCNRYTIPAVPGCQTATQIKTALEYGCDFVKYFPTSAGGIQFVKDIKAPLPQANIIPTGGVRPENISDWFDAGVSAVGIGSQLVKPGLEGNLAEVTRRAKDLVERVDRWKAP